MSSIPVGPGEASEPQQLTGQGPGPFAPLTCPTHPLLCLRPLPVPQQILAFAPEGAGLHFYCPGIRGPFQQPDQTQAL